ncbi:MAG: dihydrolipoamide acetyltransferase family protein [Planctomycetota bacterium]|jgi:pyruvate dehydrogenase E2 component (dihydrolipoamide acetyltransferase)
MAIKQPADKSHFILPDLGEGVHEAELISWKVKPGDKVEEYQTLAEMETDKALVEVPSPWTGVIKELGGAEGEIINVGSVLVTYEVGAAEPAKTKAPAAAEPSAAEREDAGSVVGSMDTGLTVSDRFTHHAEKSVKTASGKAVATPAVRRVARERGVDINLVPGTGRGGRVTAGDVQAFAGGGAAPAARAPAAPAARPAAPPAPTVTPDGAGVVERIPFRGVRRKIAEALTHSLRTAAHFGVTNEADVTALDLKRDEYAAVIGEKLSFTPFILAAACKALRQHPTLNANVDDEKQEILVKGVINLGVAVDTEHGLMVPVIKDADQLSIARISDAVADVAERCRNRTIGREELVGGTFTVSSVGMYGGMFTTPIINYPEVAILGVGEAKNRVLVKDGSFYAGKLMPLSLSCDHRVVDGAEGARFLRTLAGLLEQPDALVR